MPGGINYQALYDLQMSKDPTAQKLAAQASKNMTQQEYQEWFNFQKKLNDGRGAGEMNRTDNNVLGVPPEAFAMGLPGMLTGTGLGSKVLGLGKDIYSAGKAALPVLAVMGGGKALGLSNDAINMLGLATGLRGGPKGAVGAAEAATGEAALTEGQLLRQQLTKDGRYPPELIEKAVAQAEAKAAGLSKSNVHKEPTLSGAAADVSGGVQNDFKGRVTFGVKKKPGSIDDIMEQVLGTSRNGWEDSKGMGMDYGPLSDPAVASARSKIGPLLRKPK